MVHTLKVWHHYQLGKQILLITDHSSLTNFLKEPNMNARQAKWATFLSEFDFDKASKMERKLRG